MKDKVSKENDKPASIESKVAEDQVKQKDRSKPFRVVVIIPLLVIVAAFWFQNYLSRHNLDWNNLLLGHKRPSEPSQAVQSPSSNLDFPSNRIVAVGDLHGDWAGTIQVLRMAGIVDKEDNWIAGTDTLVQTGDIVDRGDATIPLYKLFQKLSKQAKKAGGNVFQLLGNHEVMNVHDDWRYVTAGDIDSFGGAEKRRKAFGANGWLGKYIRSRNITALVNGTVFFHGGAHPNWAALGVKNLNFLAKKALRSWDAGMKEALFGETGPLWYRGYAQDAAHEICQLLDNALRLLEAKRMVIGHTPQLNGRILSRCDGRVYVIDVGISAAYGSHRAAIEIVNDTVKPIYPK